MGGGGAAIPPQQYSYDNQYYGNDQSNMYTGQVFTPGPLPVDPPNKAYGAQSADSTDFDDEPPLLEGELLIKLNGRINIDQRMLLY